MTLDSLLQWIIAAILATLAIVTIMQWLRRRDRLHLDIVLVFTSLATGVLLQTVLEAMNVQPAWLRPVVLSLRVLHPYLLLRLVDQVRPVSLPIRMVSRVGTALSLLMIWFAPGAGTALTIAVMAYSCWLEGYDTVAFGSAASVAGGVTHWRLLHAAAAAGLITVAFTLQIVNLWIPSTVPATLPLLRILGALAALSFYFGFAPPQWLRQVWRYGEIHRLVDATPYVLRATDMAPMLDGMGEAAMRAVGGDGAAFVAWNDPGEYLEVRSGRGLIPPAGSEVMGGAIARAWETKTPQLATRPDDVGFQDWHEMPDTRRLTLYAMPIVTPEQAWGVLIVIRGRSSLFAIDDLELLAAFCARLAIRLDYAALLRNQRALIEVLDTRSADLLQTNEELSREIQNRKKAEEELGAANRELEAFSYSVSHDLRAPLRHISGFASLLERSPTASALDDTSKRYLAVIIESVARMGMLIDDLLSFSRAGRVEMHTTRVSLDRMVRDVQAEVRDDGRAGELAWTIHPLPDVDADPALLHQVFVNLLSNAVKYSRTRPHAEIEIGCIDHPDEVVIFVRDNGVGFDMAYADKLFGVFQRLHRIEEFEGTGVGLANVKRVIVRHGGRVWAEGAIDHGATFYVALPKRMSSETAVPSKIH